MEQDPDDLRQYFEACDKNGDGTIQFAEFVTLLQDLGTEMGDEECRIGFAEVDRDRDGVIDFDEFQRWWAEF
jgi:Ca2+-binding EF-hand superfamily protein